MKKKTAVTLILLLIALIITMVGGVLIYKYVEIRARNAAEDNFNTRVVNFETDKGVDCFDEVFVGGDKIVGWYFFRFDGSLYFVGEYVNSENTLCGDVINLGSWYKELEGLDYWRYIYSSGKDSYITEYRDREDNVLAGSEVILTESGLSFVNLDIGTSCSEDDDFDGYIPPVELMAFEPEESTAVLDGELLLHIKGDYYSGGEVTLSYKDSTVTVNEYAEWLDGSYVVPADNGFYVLVTMCFSNDWYETALVRYTEGNGLQLIDSMQGGAGSIELVSENSVELFSRISVFGTYGFSRVYGISDSGFTPQSPVYNFNNNPNPAYWDEIAQYNYDEESLARAHSMMDEQGRRKLTLKSDAQAYTLEGTLCEIPSGAVIIPTGVDPEAKHFFFDYNGRSFYFVYEIDEDSWSYSVGGIKEKNLFEAVFYAG